MQSWIFIKAGLRPVRRSLTKGYIHIHYTESLWTKRELFTQIAPIGDVLRYFSKRGGTRGQFSQSRPGTVQFFEVKTRSSRKFWKPRPGFSRSRPPKNCSNFDAESSFLHFCRGTASAQYHEYITCIQIYMYFIISSLWTAINLISQSWQKTLINSKRFNRLYAVKQTFSKPK